MKATILILGTISRSRRGLPWAIFVLLLVFGLAQPGLAQTDPPLNFGNNYFVTGDYVVAGVGLRGLGGPDGYATGTITMPDATTVPPKGVPAGADVVAAYLYWQTVESSQTTYAGQQGFFRGYPITGLALGNPNAPVAWSSGGCSGSAQGSKTIRTYRADVLPLLPVNSEGDVKPGNETEPATYQVRLADSGSNGGGAPLTLGASLVIIYRVLSHDFPLNSIVIYDGSYAPSNSSSTMTQTIQGFYQPAASPASKLTEIVGNGQANKYESVFLGSLSHGVTLNSVNLPSLYGSNPPFPGYYNGDWDNPTWSFPNVNYLSGTNPLLPSADSALTQVVPGMSNSGCVSWGATILSTTVRDSDNDGLLDVWEQDGGYCDAAENGGVCDHNTTDPNWVSLPDDAGPNHPDIFVQMDYMCSSLNPDGSCDTANSLLPSSGPDGAQNKITDAFTAQGIDLHLIPGNAIPEQACHDDPTASPPVFCMFPDQLGVVGWKEGFAFLKNQPLNYPDEDSCEAALDGPCIRRFQHGKKDSYHYALFGHALGVPTWSFLGENLTSVDLSSSASGTTVTFHTTSDPRFDPLTNPTGVLPGDPGGKGRVTVSDAITNPDLNGTFYVTAADSTSFTIENDSLTSSTAAPTLTTDPGLSVASGQTDTISGASDVGGEDTAVTIDSWGPDGQGTSAQAGTFMHELGHTLGLTHGGLYYTTGSYVPSIGANCKPNFQSVMNYLFQVDLLDNGTADYSEERLDHVDETSPPTAVTSDGSAATYSSTRWYALSPPGGVGTAATMHCDGTPLLPTDVPMYGVEGVTDPISPAWVNNQDINFDGNHMEDLQGYHGWAHVDLRQVGATGSLSTAGGTKGSFGFGTKGSYGFGTKGSYGFGTRGSYGFGTRGSFGFGTKGSFGFGEGHGEITRETANSVTRPPRHLTATVLKSPNAIELDWIAPTFGQIATYNIYRGNGTDPAPPSYATVSGSQTSFTDTSVSCGATYNYFVTALLSNGQESVPSNLVTVVKCGK
jgi:hypothetical protein